ncbi:hypothetical protein AP071_15875 [Rhodobacter capsulatus]|nr:hypothetical protein AP073_15770 [Rhodobacter capsulatus]KQB14231.1 hypothetical protein AP071_15875 [Rhodobacter capsulatus]
MPAARGRDPLEVQCLGDLFRREPFDRVIFENPHYHRSFQRSNLEIAPFLFAVRLHGGQHLVPVTLSSGILASLDPAFLAAARLQGDVSQLDLVHCPLHTDQHLVDLALGQGVQFDLAELQIIVKSRDVGQLARQSVQCLRQNDIELPCLGIPQQRLDAGAEHRRPGNGLVAVFASDLPAHPKRMLAARIQLVLNRGVTLLVR